jgi:hypothetical protein
LGCTLKANGEFHEITIPDVVSDTLSTDSLQYHMLPASAEERAVINPILEKAIHDSIYHTRALLVLHHGKIAGEKYAEPFDSNSMFYRLVHDEERDRYPDRRYLYNKGKSILMTGCQWKNGSKIPNLD